jgi:hypothetical protein
MKTKEIVIGQEYVVKRPGRYGTRVVVALDTGWEQGPVRAYKPLQGGTRIAVAVKHDVQQNWVPLLVRPAQVLATAEQYKEQAAQREADLEEQYAEQERQRQARIVSQHWGALRQAWLNVRLEAAGLPAVRFRWNYVTGTYDPTVDEDFLNQVLALVQS